MQHLSLPSQLGAMLRGARKSAGLSQATLASRINLSQKRLSALERDSASLSVEQMLALCSALGLEVWVQPRQPGAPQTAASAPSDAPEW
jgi:HTH-type transcriptional regulator/antitoxin HipB